MHLFYNLENYFSTYPTVFAKHFLQIILLSAHFGMLGSFLKDALHLLVMAFEPTCALTCMVDLMHRLLSVHPPVTRKVTRKLITR